MVIKECKYVIFSGKALAVWWNFLDIEPRRTPHSTATRSTMGITVVEGARNAGRMVGSSTSVGVRDRIRQKIEVTSTFA